MFLNQWKRNSGLHSCRPQNPLCQESNADPSALKQEREIDKLVYALYGLTPEEIEIVDGKE
jgi:hypothetical protein